MIALLPLQKKDFIKIKEFIEQGKIKPTIDRMYSLEQMIETHKYVEQGPKKGSVVISIFKN